MRLPHVQFTVRRMMVAVAVVAISIAARPGSDDHRYDSHCPPPQIQGEVSCVDQQNERVELTIGSDDGLTRGQELHVFRAEVPPRFLGKLRIIYVEADQSVARVIGSWNGRNFSLRKGDKVISHPR
jgi:hypothetical protein